MADEATNANRPGKVAFLGYLQFDNGASYRGAILVTDDCGRPLDFRCTAPVKPTAVQRALNGASLIPHVLVALIAKPLMDALNEEPAVFRGFARVYCQSDFQPFATVGSPQSLRLVWLLQIRAACPPVAG
jgi:hypothetical protein